MVHSIEELSLLVEDTEEAGMLGETEAEVVQKVFRLSKKRVGDCMVPRDKMAALEKNAPPDKVLEAVRHGAHTRVPVYEGDLENVVGVVNTKDLFHLFSLKGVVILDDAIYPPLFLKPDEDVATALQQFRTSHRHMALVRGEEGKIMGLITLEDILEEIVGEIEDEHDQCASSGLNQHCSQVLKPAKSFPDRGVTARCGLCCPERICVVTMREQCRGVALTTDKPPQGDADDDC
jgi:CBS domain containing-hemolysin-like protein